MDEVQQIIYQFWTDTNPITENRKKALKTNHFLGIKCNLLNNEDISRMVLNDFPLHPAYKYLAAIHKSDYLRSYFMYHFGGGYADIKFFNSANNWKQQFELINTDQQIDIIGQKEIPNGSPLVFLNDPNMLNIILSNGWFICRKHSYFAKKWLDRVNEKMNQRYDILKRYPATTPFGGKNYPLRWAELQGEIFHAVCHEVYWENPLKIRNTLIPGAELTKNYR